MRAFQEKNSLRLLFSAGNAGIVFGMGFCALPFLTLFFPRVAALILGLMGLWCFSFTALRRKSWSSFYVSHFEKILIALIIWMGVSTLWSLTPSRTFLSVLKFTALTGVGTFVLRTVSQTLDVDCLRNRFWIFTGYFFAFVLSILFIITEGALLKPFVPETNEHIILLLNRYASIVSVFIWPLLYFVARKKGALIASFLGLFLIGSLFFLKNDTSKLACLLGGLTWGCGYYLRRKMGHVLAVVTMLLVLGAPFLHHGPLNPVNLNQFSPTLFEKLKYSFHHRLVFWSYGADIVLESPWVGSGYDTARTFAHDAANQEKNKARFRQYILPLESLSPTWGKHYEQWSKKWANYLIPLHTHNAPLQWWLELGFPGALLMTLLCMVVVLQGVRLFDEGTVKKHRWDLPLYAQYVSTMAISGVSYGAWQSWWIAAVWLGAAHFLFWKRASEA